MLNRSTLASTAGMVQALGSKGISLYPVPNTPLSSLVTATRAAGMEKGIGWVDNPTSSAQAFANFIDNAEFMANKKDEALGGSPHDFTMDDVTSQLTPLTANHFSYVKNTVIPGINTFVENVTALVGDIGKNSLSHMEVSVWNPPAPIFTGSLIPFYTKFSETSFSNVTLNFKLPEITETAMNELLLTLSPRVDQDILEWAAIKGTSFFVNLWRVVFQAQGGSLASLLNSPDGTDNAIAIFLMSSKLHDNPPAGTDMALLNYNNNMADLRNQTALFLTNYTSKYEMAVKGGILIRSIENDSKVIVNALVYKDWISNGGCNEVLFGLTLQSGIRDFTVLGINNKTKELLDSWNRHVTYRKTLDSINMYNAVKGVLLTCFTKQFEPNAQDLVLFNRQLTMLTENDTRNLWPACQRILCRSIFGKTDAARILADVEAISADSPEMDIREVTALAMLKYICRWVTCQIKPALNGAAA